MVPTTVMVPYSKYSCSIIYLRMKFAIIFLTMYVAHEPSLVGKSPGLSLGFRWVTSACGCTAILKQTEYGA